MSFNMYTPGMTHRDTPRVRITPTTKVTEPPVEKDGVVKLKNLAVGDECHQIRNGVRVDLVKSAFDQVALASKRSVKYQVHPDQEVFVD